MSEDDLYANVHLPTRRNKGFGVKASQRRSRVTVERVALVVLSLLLLATASALVLVLGVKRLGRVISAATKETTSTPGSRVQEDLTTCPLCPAEPAATCPNSVARCGDDWELHGTKCYYFSPSSARLSWKESRAMCRWLRGDLVKIESREEQQFLDMELKKLMVDEEDKFWIGLTDSMTEGQWVWTDGSALDSGSAFWTDDGTNAEPDNWKDEDPEGEDCVRVGQTPQTRGLNWWYDGSCKKKQRSICEKQAKSI